MEFRIGDIEEIVVKYQDGQEIVFRGGGIEKLRKLMKASPPLRSAAPKKATKVVIENSGSEDEASASGSEEKPAPKKSRKRPTTATGGYSTVNLEYGGPVAPNVGAHSIKKGLSPHDIAKEMQRQATMVSGIQY